MSEDAKVREGWLREDEWWLNSEYVVGMTDGGKGFAIWWAIFLVEWPALYALGAVIGVLQWPWPLNSESVHFDGAFLCAGLAFLAAFPTYGALKNKWIETNPRRRAARAAYCQYKQTGLMNDITSHLKDPVWIAGEAARNTLEAEHQAFEADYQARHNEMLRANHRRREAQRRDS